MNFDTFALDVARIRNANEMQRREHTVVIEVHRPGWIGGTPAVAVSAVFKGFDWDNGRVIICPQVPLTELTLEQVVEITESVRKGQSWHAYQEYKKYKAQLENAALEHAKVAGQRDALLSALTDALEWIDAVPSETALPAMPGFDRDEVNNLISSIKGGAE